MRSNLELTSAQWRKSTYSSDQGGECVECAPLGAAAWRKSTYSGDQGGDCVEIAEAPCLVAVRDSKIPDGPAFTVSRTAFTTFVRAAGIDL
ncbi:DUF397 domain-containing protein [Streptomyces flavidovirens]|uniref:DUF397 domain-containing protein n=1 Tax=Streptomyces flavidovirens TaxID=67298 RepID=UPI00342DB837